MIQFKFTGVEKHVKAVGKAKEGKIVQIREGVDKCLDVVLAKSNYYVPKDTLALMKSGRKELTGTGMSVVGKVMYGDETAYYALYVHEDMEAHHEAPTCAKFLERAFRETRGTQVSILKRQNQGKTVLTVNGGVVK